jgi:hypothetical protein
MPRAEEQTPSPPALPAESPTPAQPETAPVSPLIPPAGASGSASGVAAWPACYCRERESGAVPMTLSSWRKSRPICVISQSYCRNHRRTEEKLNRRNQREQRVLKPVCPAIIAGDTSIDERFWDRSPRFRAESGAVSPVASSAAKLCFKIA